MVEIAGAGEDIRRVALLGNFYDDGALQFKDVLIAEQKELATALSQLIVEEGVVIGLSRDLGDIEIGRDPPLVAEPLQILSFERFTFYPRPYALN